MEIAFITLISLLIGYYLGSKETRQQINTRITDTVDALLPDNKPKPGVVNHLTPDEVKAKHDPRIKGNKEAFDEFFKRFPKIG